MRVLGNILGALLIVMGAIWILQGVNILPGSFMTGQTIWTWRGGFATVAGIVLLLAVNRKRR